MLLGACSQAEEDKLAVAKISAQELQNTPFVALNYDIPGTPVTIQRYLVPGKFTIVYFYSPYSEEDFNEALKELVVRDRKLAVRTVNVNREGVEGVDWDSPVVEAARLNSLPYFFIYDLAGSLRAHGRPAHEQIVQWVTPSPAAETSQEFTDTQIPKDDF